MTGDRFSETGVSDGVTTSYAGSYGYEGIGPDAGRLTLTYDDGDVCGANLYFSSLTAGWFASRCTGSDYPADGYWIGGSWSAEDADDTSPPDSPGTATDGECYVGLLVEIGESCTYPGTMDAFTVNDRGRGSFLTFLAGIRIRIANQTINGRVYDLLASHQGDGVWRIDRVAGSTEAPADGGMGNTGAMDDDNDGVPNANDAFPQDPDESVDTDGDGTGDNADTDDDNDGVSDIDDSCPLDLDDTCLPLLEISGTLFVDPDILTPSDPTTFRSVTYTGRGDRVMFDRRQNQFVTYNAFLFDAAFTDGFRLEIQVNPEFQTSDAARQEAEKFGWLIGQLPRALRQPDFQTVWIHKGVQLFGGRNNNVLIHTGQADLYEADGILEEALIHEGAHTSLDSRHALSSGWVQAQQDDMDFISTYAKDHPTREDVAESFPM